MKDFNSPEYVRSRNAYIIQCAFAYFVQLLVTDAFLAKLLTNLGISDAMVGIISSFISMAFVVQLLSIFLVKLKISAKKLVITFDTLSIFFFMLLYLIPFMPLDQTQRTVLVMGSVIIAYVANYLVASICFKWANSYVEPSKRAVFSAKKEMLSLFSGMVFTTVMGYVIDRYESIGNLEGGFLFLSCAILVLNICNFSCYMMIKKDEPQEHKDEKQPLKEVLKNTLGKKEFQNVVIMMVLWNVATYFTIGFMGVFKTKDLGISLLVVQIINMAANSSRFLLSVPFGRYSDRTSFAKGFRIALYLAAAAFLINVFTTNSTWFLVIPFTILYYACLAGTSANSYNIVYSYVDSAYFVQAMALKNSIAGICGFAASILAGKLLDVIQKNGNRIFGIHIYGQQLLSGISFVLILVTILFVKNVIEKQKVTVQ